MNIGRTKSAFRDFADHSSAILCAHLEARFSHRLAVSRLQFQECTSFDSRSSVLGTVRFKITAITANIHSVPNLSFLLIKASFQSRTLLALQPEPSRLPQQDFSFGIRAG